MIKVVKTDLDEYTVVEVDGVQWKDKYRMNTSEVALFINAGSLVIVDRKETTDGGSQGPERT